MKDWVWDKMVLVESVGREWEEVVQSVGGARRGRKR